MEDGERLSLPEDLLLIAVDPYTGVLRVPDRIPHGVAGAILAKLIAEGRMWPMRAGRVYARDTEPTGDALLDQLVAEVAEHRDANGRPRGRDAHRWLREIGLRATGPYMERLTARGVLGVLENPAPRGPFRDIRYPLLAPDTASLAFRQVDEAVRSPIPPEPRALLLTALAAAVRLDQCFYPRREEEPLRRRMRHLITAYPIAQTVHDLVLMDEAAQARPMGWW